MKRFQNIARRTFLKASVVTASTASLSALTSFALAQKTPKSVSKNASDIIQTFQAPGFFRFSLGEFKITIISDGSLGIPVSSFISNVPEAQVKSFLKSIRSDIDMHYSHTNTCLIDTGKERILIDAGSGTQFQPSAGRLLKNLKISGYEADDIDKIVLTHAHPDHAWGLLDQKTSKPNFPKAQYYINAVEWDYWTQDNLETEVPKPIRAMVPVTRNTLIPIAAKTKRINPGDEIAPGIIALDTAGHTPGHISVLASSGKDSLIVSGDVVLHGYASFEKPQWHYRFDMDPEKAAEVRTALLDKSVADNAVFVGFHMPFPGVGHVIKSGKAYRWLPMLWKWN